MIGTKPILSLKFAAEIKDNVRCVVVTVETVTLKLVKLKGLMIGVFGRSMMRDLADQTSMGTLTLIDLQMLVSVVLIKSFNELVYFLNFIILI